MRVPWRRSSRCPTADEIDSAYRWNKWADEMVTLWESVDSMAGGAERERLAARARSISDSMFQLDPPMWRAITARWPKRYRDRRFHA